MNCPICGKYLILNEDRFYWCNNEFYYSSSYTSITADKIYIDYDFHQKQTLFSKNRDSFILPIRFKVINNSAEETYSHYYKMRMFS